MDEKIYITGSSGMLGKNLIDKLKNLGYSNLVYKTSKELNLTERQKVFDFFEKEKPVFVIHLASILGGMQDKIDNPARYLRDNLLINTNVIDACFKYNVKKLINLSSTCIYPTNAKQPANENEFKYGPLELINEGYALSKIVALKLCTYYNNKNANFITIIAPNLYGKHDHFNESGHVIPSMMCKMQNAKKNNNKDIQIWGSGNAKREFLFAEDLAEIIIMAIKIIIDNAANEPLKP